jgi:ABC-2 type transport system permease protein
MLPVWLIQPIIEHPDSPLAIGFSLFPTTALPTLSMRVAFAKVPSWQIMAAAAILSLSAAGAVWLAGRAFRLGMLRYGQNLDLRELIVGSE